MQNLAKQYPDIHTDLETKGYKCIAHLMTIFDKQTQMDRALDLNGATSNWCRGKNVPAWTIERRASEFIAQRALAKPSLSVVQKAPPKPTEKVAPPQSQDATFLVVCPPEKATKVERVLTLMGCEAVEV